MKNISFMAAGALFASATSYAANAETATCNLHPADLLATFGYAASGQALKNITELNLPAGPFSEIGTATVLTVNDDGHGNLVGTWSSKFQQNDSSGIGKAFTIPGTFTVSKTDCRGDFSWNGVGLVFHVVFVNGAREFRAASALPGIILSYTSGEKL